MSHFVVLLKSDLDLKQNILRGESVSKSSFLAATLGVAKVIIMSSLNCHHNLAFRLLGYLGLTYI